MSISNWNRVVLVPALLVGVVVAGTQTFFAGCDPAVSDEATVTVEGRLLLQTGVPAANIEIRLNKSDVDVLDADWVVGHIVNQDKTPFKTAKTDGQGRFSFRFPGAEANSGNQIWAAYFVAYAIHPEDPDGQLAIATDSFSFSNQDLDIVLPDMRFWDILQGGLNVSDTHVTVGFGDTDLPPENGTYLVHFDGTAWTAEVKGTSFSLPLYALEPCTNSVVDDPAECDVKTTHTVQIISLTDGLRYRSARHTFEATNPLGMGLWLRDPDDNRSATTCSGKALFDLNDGKFSGENAMVVTGGGLEPEDLNCIIVDLHDATELDRVLLHNGTVMFHEKAVLEISTTLDADPDAARWDLKHTWEGSEQRFWNVNLDVYLAGTRARYVRLLMGGTDETPFWFHIGELSVFGLPTAGR